MKLIIRAVHILLLANTIALNCKHISKQDLAFIEAHSVSPHVATILDTYAHRFVKGIAKMHKAEANNEPHERLIWEFDELPAYIIKYRYDRVKGMKIMQDCIERNNLYCLTVPTKFLYHIKNTGSELSNSHYVTVAERQEFAEYAKHFNDEEVHQICILLKESGYNDFAAQNVLRLPNNKLAFIDTELRDFNKEKNYAGLAHIFTPFSWLDINTSFSEESLKYILSQLLEIIPPDPLEYSELYSTIHSFLIESKKGMKWDYVTYFENLFPKPTPSIKED